MWRFNLGGWWDVLTTFLRGGFPYCGPVIADHGCSSTSEASGIWIALGATFIWAHAEFKMNDPMKC